MPQQIAVITGAGTGIGRATVRLLASYGFDIALLGRHQQRLDNAAEEVRNAHLHALALQVDVSDAAQIQHAAERVEQELGPITVWVNAAGVAAFGPVLSLEAATYRRVMEVNYLGTVHGTQAALACMRRRGKGTIVNLGLGHGLRGLPLQSALSGPHAAINSFCDSVRAELRALPDRIDLTVVHLPSINTPRALWSRNSAGHALKPVGTIYEPEVAARAIGHAILGHHRDIWVGRPHFTLRAMRALAPSLLDRYHAQYSFKTQYAALPENQPPSPGAEDALDHSPEGAYAAHGPYESISLRERGVKPPMITPKRHLILGAVMTFTLSLGVFLARHTLTRRR